MAALEDTSEMPIKDCTSNDPLCEENVDEIAMSSDEGGTSPLIDDSDVRLMVGLQDRDSICQLRNLNTDSVEATVKEESNDDHLIDIYLGPETKTSKPPIKEAELSKCQHCSFSTDCEYTLALHHYDTHLCPPEVSCTHCLMVFSSEKDVAIHTKVVHNAHQYLCEVCNYTASSKEDLQSHCNTHEDISCHLCQFTAKIRVELHLHHIIHHGDSTVEDPSS